MDYIIKINGIYDILCAVSILGLNIPILKDLHISMLVNHENRVVERFFAYWILTYGCMRISNNKDLVRLSYYIEAICISNECLQNTLDPVKSSFVIVSSIILALITS